MTQKKLIDEISNNLDKFSINELRYLYGMLQNKLSAKTKGKYV